MRNSLRTFQGNRFPSWGSFDDLFERAFQNPWSFVAETRPEAHEVFQTGVEVDENDGAFLISVDLPGTRREDVQIELNGNVLTVTAERKRDSGIRNGGERHSAKFQRSFKLPTTIDSDGVQANLEDGVLTIALPKSQAAKPRAIQIQTGKSGLFSKLLGSDKKQEKVEKDANENDH